jgi:uncharacterized BrkB/YihY/UPF0761 family membrane protein
MTKTTPASAAPARRRNPFLIALDVIVSVIVMVFGLVLGLIVYASGEQYAAINDGVCTSGPYEGLTCNAGALSVIVFATVGIALLAWALSVGMFIVNLIKRKYAFYWPIIGVVVMVASFWVGTFFVGLVAERSA